MDRNQILSTDFGITKLVNIRFCGTGDRTRRTLATGVVTQALLSVEREICFPHQALLHSHDAVRSVVVVNRRLLAWAPADHQHLDRVVATNAMAPVVALFETEIRLQVLIDDLDAGEPGTDLFKRRWVRLAVQTFNQFVKADLTDIERFIGNGSFGIY